MKFSFMYQVSVHCMHSHVLVLHQNCSKLVPTSSSSIGFIFGVCSYLKNGY